MGYQVIALERSATMGASLPVLADVRAAAKRIEKQIHETPVATCETLGVISECVNPSNDEICCRVGLRRIAYVDQRMRMRHELVWSRFRCADVHVLIYLAAISPDDFSVQALSDVDSQGRFTDSCRSQNNQQGRHLTSQGHPPHAQ